MSNAAPSAASVLRTCRALTLATRQPDGQRVGRLFVISDRRNPAHTWQYTVCIYETGAFVCENVPAGVALRAHEAA